MERSYRCNEGRQVVEQMIELKIDVACTEIELNYPWKQIFCGEGANIFVKRIN
jgi:hypothetical protein